MQSNPPHIFYHEEDIHNDVKVQRRENVALFLIEFPYEYLHRRNDSSVQQQQTTDKKLYCNRQAKRNTFELYPGNLAPGKIFR